ncbi:MAG: class I SAM-dependent methyltransferase [bacterium]|nr:class I SAM-dependent methyltransferase [bacterium]
MIDHDRMRNQWRALAPAWIEETAAGRNIYRDGLLDAWMLEAVGDVTGKDVIDIACGEGRFCRMLAEGGARVTGVDICPEFIEYAQAHCVDDETYLVGDAQTLDQMPDAAFDLAVSFVTLVDIPDLDAALSAAYRVLRPGGRFVVCNLQPMITAAFGWLKEEDGTKIHFKLDNYFDESIREMGMHGEILQNVHRTLSTYINGFIASGFVLEGLREPTPSAEQIAAYPDVDDNLRVPLFAIYLLRKPEA